MTASTLAAVCGSILSVASIAQNSMSQDRGRDQDRGRTTQRMNNQDTTNRTTDAQTASTARNAESVLQQIEGVWKVDVHINPVAFGHRYTQDLDRTRTTRGTTTTTNQGRNNQGVPNQNQDQYDNPDNAPINDDGSVSDLDAWHDPQVDDEGATGRNNTTDNTSNRNNTGNGQTERDRMRQTPPGESNIADTNFTGYAKTKLVLGDNVLKETLVMPDMKKGFAKSMNMNKDRSTTGTDSMSEDKNFRGVSYISFDKNSNTYNIVFMDNCSGKMFHDTGTYNASTRQIVFNGADIDQGMNHGSSMNDRDRGSYDNTSTRGRTTTTTQRDRDTRDRDMNDNTNPADRDRGVNDNNMADRDRGYDNNTTSRDRDMDANAGTEGARAYYHGRGHGGSNMDNVRVVLDVISNDQYRVTMYRVDPGQAATWTPPSNDNRANRDNSLTGNNNTNNRNAANQSPSATGDVIYTATYTRAQGSDRSEYERLLTQAE